MRNHGWHMGPHRLVELGKGLLGLSFTIHSSREKQLTEKWAQWSPCQHPVSPDRKGEGSRGRRSAMAEKRSRELTAILFLVLIHTLNTCPRDLSLNPQGALRGPGQKSFKSLSPVRGQSASFLALPGMKFHGWEGGKEEGSRP